MTRITDRDILLELGGYCFPKYGTLVARRQPPGVRDGEGAKETYTRVGVSRAGTTRAGLIVPCTDDIIPAWHWNPFTGAPTEYPIPIFEPGATNLLLQSANFGTTWTNVASSESLDIDTAPDGTVTADRIIEDGTVGAHGMSQDVTITADFVYALSVWIRKDSTRGILALQLTNTAFTNTVTAWVTLATGVITNTAVTGTGTHIASYVEDWDDLYRVVLVGRIGGGATTLRCRILGAATTSSTSYTGDGVSYLSIWGAQCEQGGHATSYIPTTTTTASRSAPMSSIPFHVGPQGKQVYEHLIYHGANSFQRNWVIGTVNDNGLTRVSGSSGVGDANAGFRVRRELPGSFVDTSIIGGAAVAGDEVELLTTLFADGLHRLDLRVNGGAISSSTTVDGGALPSVWGAATLTITFDARWRALIGAMGTGFTMDDYAALVL